MTAEVNISDGSTCVVTDDKLVDLCREALTDIFGAESVISLELRPTAEDFGYYPQVYPSVFYRIGVGGEPVAAGCKQEQIAGRLHTPIFNPDEKALEYAVAGLVVLALSLK